MPLSSPGEMRQRHPRPVEEEFVVFLQGIPPHCRWQELKDLVRQTALHIRQAVVYDDSHGHPTGVGQIIIKNEDEAWRTYNRLSTNGWNGLSLTVTLARASDPTKAVAGPTKSPPTSRAPYASGFSATSLVTPIVSSPPDSPMSPTFTQAPDFGAFFSPMNDVCSPHLVPVSPESLNYAGPYSFPANNAVPFQPCYFFNAMPDQHTPMQTRRYQQVSDSSDRRRSSGSGNNGMMSPISAPASRNIFIQFLSRDTTSEQLKGYLAGAGTVDRCEVQERKPMAGRARVYATATLQTTDEAKQAISMFDGSFFGGAKIQVRFDRDFGGNKGRGSSGIARATNAYSRGASNSNSATTTTKDAKPWNARGQGAATPTAPRSMSKEGPSLDKNNGEPLVVNGSCVGLKAGRSNLDVVCYEDELSRKTREIQL